MAILLGASLLTVERSTGGWVDGDFVKTIDCTFTIRGSLQDISGRERQDLPEGYRTRRVQWLACQPNVRLYATRVQAQTSDKPAPSDIVTDDQGRRHEVIRFQDWRRHNASTAHTAYFVAEIGEDGSI